MSPTAPSAWYPDPLNRHQHRYWNGTQWTRQIRSAKKHTADRWPAGVEQPTPGADLVKHQRTMTWAAVGVLVAIIAVVAGLAIYGANHKDPEPADLSTMPCSTWLRESAAQRDDDAQQITDRFDAKDKSSTYAHLFERTLQEACQVSPSETVVHVASVLAATVPGDFN